MRILTSTLFFLLLISCDREMEELKAQNEELKSKNDSLTDLIGDLKLVPWLTNLNFETTVNDTFTTNVHLIQENGIIVDSVDIKGLSKTRTEKMIELLETNHGTSLKFTSDSIGTFELKAYSRVPSWDDKVVPLIFPVEVKKTGHNNK